LQGDWRGGRAEGVDRRTGDRRTGGRAVRRTGGQVDGRSGGRASDGLAVSSAWSVARHSERSEEWARLTFGRGAKEPAPSHRATGHARCPKQTRMRMKRGRFNNDRGVLPNPGLRVMLTFLVRRIRVSLRPRPGAAPTTPFDRSALSREPSITWIGHSTFLVRMDGVSFLTDPMFSERASPFSFMGPRRMVPPGVPLDELPEIDFVLLSHDHYDHADRATVQRLAGRGVRFVVPLGMGEWIQAAGGQATELGWWQDTELDGVRIHCVPAQHFSGRSLRDRFRRLWAGWVVSGPTRRFYHAGDTGYSTDFREIGRRLGPIDLATVPVGAYLPAAIMHQIHTTPEEALQLAQEVKARRVVAMHYGVFDLSDEPPDDPPRRFRAEAERLGWGEDRAWIMKVGETRAW
jgi:N-acyl-phosphatidylethanolamine-hydrolysing phospholipase D